MLLPLGGHWDSEAKGQRGFPGNLLRHRNKTITVHHSAFWDPLRLLLYPAEWKDTKQLPIQRPGGREEFLGLIFLPDSLSVCSSRHWSHILRSHRKPHRGGKSRIWYASHSPTVQTGAKPRLADVPPGQLQRAMLRLCTLDFLSPCSSRMSLWLAISNSGFSITLRSTNLTMQLTGYCKGTIKAEQRHI